jgi:hypothetical protein
MGKGNIYNDIHKGLYGLAIVELENIKKKEPHLINECDSLIDILKLSNINGKKPSKKDIDTYLNIIIKF